MIQGRDPGDESDALTPRLAWVGLIPVCPKCGCQLAPPFRLWDRDTRWHEVTCFAGGCGQRVVAKWFEEQRNEYGSEAPSPDVRCSCGAGLNEPHAPGCWQTHEPGYGMGV